MRTLIIADIHGNLPALEAVLATPEAQSCQRIISLGDQVNYGPSSRAVMEKLLSLGAVMLLGNHEERLPYMETAAYQGYNWAILRWTKEQLYGLDMSLPTEYAEPGKLFTHVTPGDTSHLIQPEDIPASLAALPPHISFLFSGHNHMPWRICSGGRIACNPGALGMVEDGVGSNAPFVVMDETPSGVSLTRYTVPYDLVALKRSFIQTGCSAVAPEMARIVLHTMLTGEYQSLLRLVQFVSALGDLGDRAVWREADARWPWREPLSTPEYWRTLKEELP